MSHTSKYALLLPGKYRPDSEESVSELLSLHSFFTKRAYCANGKTSKSLDKRVARAQNIFKWSMLEAQWVEKSGLLTNGTQRRCWCGIAPWETRLSYNDDNDNDDVIRTFWILFKFIIHVLKWNSDILNAFFFCPELSQAFFICVIFSDHFSDPVMWIWLALFFLDRETEIWRDSVTWPLGHPVNRWTGV